MMDRIYGFTIESEKHRKYRRTIEDSYALDEARKVIAVADGVTRDPLEVLPDLNTEAGKLEFFRHYPRPSPAKLAADIFTRNFIKLANASEQNIKNAFVRVNQRIKTWNNSNMKNPDYLTRDFAGCVASGAIVSGDNYFYGFICDCGVVVFNKDGKIKFITESEDPHRLDKYIWQDPQVKGKTWSDPDVRARIRSHFRNNPNNPHSFGVLTGEEVAMNYVRTGSGKLSSGDIIMVYTDDARPILTSKKFAEKIKARDQAEIENLMQAKVNNEGSLAWYVKD